MSLTSSTNFTAQFSWLWIVLKYDEDVGRATGSSEVREDFISNLSRISQLTGEYRSVSFCLIWLSDHLGFSDPIYAEAYVKMHGFDIMLGKSILELGFIGYWPGHEDVLLVNQTSNTLQNLCLDFATLGDLKLVERPGVYTIAPHGFQSIKATIKVMRMTLCTCIYMQLLYVRCPRQKLVSSSAASCGRGPQCQKLVLSWMIFTLISWITSNLRTVMKLKWVVQTLFSYVPNSHSATQFRSMWTEFEWENRVNVTTTVSWVPQGQCVSLVWYPAVQWSSRLPQARDEIDKYVMSHPRRCHVWRLRLLVCEHVRPQLVWWVIWDLVVIIQTSMPLLTLRRRRCTGQPEHRKDGGGFYNWTRSNQKQNARHCTVVRRSYHNGWGFLFSGVLGLLVDIFVAQKDNKLTVS